ncbi:SGT1-domain-containing protein [Testicularia cyperi]|uniref:SGT1-domain-containing protein n=1 Tax=Testicularia cyperi TaxID=1882483 RepID=A0A317XWH4_9BASI|nr:SGT1-domain-containing protein [Testicularia cyperi]
MTTSVPTAEGALPFADVGSLLSAAASAEHSQALVSRIFPVMPKDAQPSTIDEFAYLSALQRQLGQLITSQTTNIDGLGNSYLWHREAPSISIVSHAHPSGQHSQSKSNGDSVLQPSHLVLRLRTGGECIEDEWLAIHLLLQATLTLTRYDIICDVENEDGQILLIEAADALPDWITPENATNRVWLYGGHMHLLPPHLHPIDKHSPSVDKAATYVRDPSVITRAEDEIEAAALAHVRQYPLAATDHLHQTLAYLPLNVARILRQDPQIISSCVSSVISRDVVSTRASARLSHFPPPVAGSESRSVDSSAEQSIILTPVRMTRHLYAQLFYDRFFPPRQLGRDWQAAVEKYRLRMHHTARSSRNAPKIEDEESIQEEIREGRWRDMGAKIWCGLEMAYDESVARQGRTSKSFTSQDDVATAIPLCEKERLIASLQHLGYFGAELRGSARWTQLETAAIEQWRMQNNNADVAEQQTHSLCDRIDAVRAHKSSTRDQVVSVSSNASKPELSRHEDSDAWMFASPDDADVTVLPSGKRNDQHPPRSAEEEAYQRLNMFASKLEGFVKTRSDPQGAMFEDEVDPDEDISDEDLLFEVLDEEEQEQKIKRAVDQRMKATGEQDKQKLVETLIPRMTQEEWSSRPAPVTNVSALANSLDTSGKPETDQDVEMTSKDSKPDFVTSIDKIAAERASKAQDKRAASASLVKRTHLSKAEEELQRRLTSQYMKQAASFLTSERYDGASDSDSEELEQEIHHETRRQRAREYDLELDDDPEKNDTLCRGARPNTQDELQISIPEFEADEDEEMQSFLEFARTSLGITKEHYQRILMQRREKGAFVPKFADSKDQSSEAKETAANTLPAQSSVPSKSDPDLGSFDGVMTEMDRRLNELKEASSEATSRSSQSNPAAEPLSSSNLSAEEEELLSHLLKSGSDLPSFLQMGLSSTTNSDSAPDLPSIQDSIRRDQLADFLASYQAQSASSAPSGPVELLMRRFGLGSLPLDSDRSAAMDQD